MPDGDDVLLGRRDGVIAANRRRLLHSRGGRRTAALYGAFRHPERVLSPEMLGVTWRTSSPLPGPSREPHWRLALLVVTRPPRSARVGEIIPRNRARGGDQPHLSCTGRSRGRVRGALRGGGNRIVAASWRFGGLCQTPVSPRERGRCRWSRGRRRHHAGSGDDRQISTRGTTVREVMGRCGGGHLPDTPPSRSGHVIQQRGLAASDLRQVRTSWRGGPWTS